MWLTNRLGHRTSLLGGLSIFLFSILSCTEARVGGEALYLATYDREEMDFFPLAKVTGSVRVQDGCVLMSSGSETLLPLWPDGYRVLGEDPEIRIATVDGDVVAVEGVTVELGGGQLGPGEAASLALQEIPSKCRGYAAYLVSPDGET